MGPARRLQREPAQMDVRRRILLDVPWSTICRLIAAAALPCLCPRLVWVFLLLLIAIVISVGLLPIVEWLEQRRWARWSAATAVVGAIVAVIVLFTIVT